MMRAIVGLGFVVCLSSSGFSQPAFDIADVQVSPRSDWVKTLTHSMQGGFLAGDQYQIRRATMLDLIKTAYTVDADKVFGGPSWLDYDRFEIVAKTKPGTRPATLKLMLQTLLAERFHLVAKLDTQPVPGYILTTGKGNLKLKPAADDKGSSGCQNNLRVDAGTPYNNFQCRNMTMAEFAAFLHGPPVSRPVMDATGLDGVWDIDLVYPAVNLAAGSPSGGIIGAVESVGLKLENGNVPQPVLSVVSVSEQPSANPAGVTNALPPLPAPEFEVASVNLSGGAGMTTSPRFEPGGRVTANGMPPFVLIRQAWDLAPYEQPVGMPRFLTAATTDYNVTIVAKAPEGTSPDRDALNAMLRALLIDRYKMVVHYEDRTMDTDTLIAVKPKLTKADPSGRTECTRQAHTRSDGARLTHLACQNITMAQFAEQIQAYDSNVFYPVLDGTGIDGAWDFALDYDPLAGMAGIGVRFVGAAPAEGQASDPSGIVSFADAIQKQLGLKLEVHKQPQKVLVIDHMEEFPTEN